MALAVGVEPSSAADGRPVDGGFVAAARRAGDLRRRRCRGCRRPLFGWSEVCRSRRCPVYARTWAGDQRRKLFENLRAYGGPILLSAVTAPGADERPWDESACTALGPHTHSGLLGCRVVATAAQEWNQTAPARWRRLHRRAYQDVAKRCGRPPSLLTRVWELQPRGVLHAHPVLAYGTASERVAARTYLDRLAELAPRYGFGFVHHRRDKVKPQPAENAAAYLSSYFVKGRGSKATLWESVTSGAMPLSIIHVSVRLTARTRCTMRNLRLRRALFVVWSATLPLDEVDAVARLIAAFPGNVELVPVTAPDRAPPAV